MSRSGKRIWLFSATAFAMVAILAAPCHAEPMFDAAKIHSDDMLTLSVALGKTKELDALLSGGVRPAVGDENTYMPFYYSIVMDRPDCLYVLLKHDINPDKLLAKNEYRPPLPLAATFGKLRCVEILIDFGFPVNQVDEVGCSALYRAVIIQKSEIISLLVSKGAVFNDKDKRDLPPDAVLWAKQHLKLTIPAFQWIQER